MRTRTFFALVAMLTFFPVTDLGAQLGPPGTQFWNQDSPDVPIAMEAGAEFGFAVAAGDFDCDGDEDLAIGMPGEDLTAGDNAGRLLLLWGTRDGLTAVDSTFWGQNSPVIGGDAGPNEFFGEVLASGDFDNDGCDDLAVGVPRDDVAGVNTAGAVNVLYGSEDGLTGDGGQYLHQNVGSIHSSLEAGDFFGGALAVGDFNDDGIDDLAIGSDGENWGTVNDAGIVHVLFGSISGLQTGQQSTRGSVSASTPPLLLRRGDLLNGSLQEGELLGAALAAGNFVVDLISPGDELAIGAPGSDIGSSDQGGVVVLASQLDGAVFSSEWSQATAGVGSAPEDFDRFGGVLVAGNFDGEGVDELAVGVHEEDFDGSDPILGSVGVVHVLDFVGGNHQTWRQDDLPPEDFELNDAFGFSLAVGDYDADGVDDLAIGVPREDLGSINNTGIIHVVHGERGTGLTADGRQLWLQTIDPNQDFDEFGYSLVAGRFTGRGGRDLAIGAPFEDIGSFDGTGAVNVLYSESLFTGDFEIGDDSRWE